MTLQKTTEKLLIISTGQSTCFNMRKAEYDVTVLSDCVTGYDKRKIDEMLSYYEKQGCKLIHLADFLK